MVFNATFNNISVIYRGGNYFFIIHKLAHYIGLKWGNPGGKVLIFTPGAYNVPASCQVK
jgi:hypothetical protein